MWRLRVALVRLVPPCRKAAAVADETKVLGRYESEPEQRKVVNESRQFVSVASPRRLSCPQRLVHRLRVRASSTLNRGWRANPPAES